MAQEQPKLATRLRMSMGRNVPGLRCWIGQLLDGACFIARTGLQMGISPLCRCQFAQGLKLSVLVRPFSSTKRSEVGMDNNDVLIRCVLYGALCIKMFVQRCKSSNTSLQIACHCCLSVRLGSVLVSHALQAESHEENLPFMARNWNI